MPGVYFLRAEAARNKRTSHRVLLCSSACVPGGEAAAKSPGLAQLKMGQAAAEEAEAAPLTHLGPFCRAQSYCGSSFLVAAAQAGG